MIEIVSVETPSLGDRSYLATDGSVAIMVDPQRDIDRVMALADRRGVRITGVFETHIHNDYVTGGLALAQAVGAAYYLNAADHVGFTRIGITDGDVIETGEIRVHAVATPGHTFTHLSYALEDSGLVIAVFTGGSLLNGSTGRTDLLGAEHTVTLARAQHRSAQRLAAEMPAEAKVCPTHGFGSFCSATPTSGAASTIGMERTVNPALTLAETDYVESMLAALDAYPAYYAHMAPANAAGPPAPDLREPQPASSGELRRRIEAGEWVVDLRARIAFAGGHVRGTLAFEFGDLMTTYLGWLIPWGAPLTLLGETPDQVAQAQRELARIWADRPAAAASGGPPRWAAGTPLASVRLAKFADLAVAMAAAAAQPVVLDVRRRLEWAESHIAGARHIPLYELSGRAGELPPGEVWVHCQSGYRSIVAASLLAGRGRQVVNVDDDFGNAAAAGLPLQPARAGRP